MTRLLVTGGEGMLGRDLAREAERMGGFEVRAMGRGALDVRDRDAMLAQAEWLAGGWVVHCAANVNVEGCAREPEEARAVIVDGTANAVALAQAAGARLFFPQSFLVYDGAVNPIPETETPRPLSLYGELKLEAEQLVRAGIPDPLIVRMAGFFGGEEADKNFVGRIIPAMHNAIREGERTFKVGDRVWQPTWTRDLAFNALQLIRADASGLWHMACHGHATFADIAREIVKALGWSAALEIEDVSAATVSGSELGRRPDVAILACDRLADEQMDLQRDWRATLHAYLRQPFFDRYRLEGTRS